MFHLYEQWITSFLYITSHFVVKDFWHSQTLKYASILEHWISCQKDLNLLFNLRIEFWEKVEVYFLWHGFECKFNQRGLSFERSLRSKLCERTLKSEFCGMSIFWALLSHLNSIGAPDAYMVIGPILQNFGVKHQAFITHDYSRNFL